VVPIYPCSSDNTSVYLHKRNQWGDAMVVPPDKSMPLVSCPCRENWYPFNPIPVILLLYTFTKEKDLTPVTICWQLMLSFFFNRATAMVFAWHLVYGDPWFQNIASGRIQCQHLFK
jgi:hypothetical protein